MEDINAIHRQRNEIGNRFVKLKIDDGSTSMQPETAQVFENVLVR